MKPIKQYEFTAELMVEMYKEGNKHKISNGFPSNGKVVDCGYEPSKQTFYITVEHPKFDKILEGGVIPRERIEFENTK